LTERRQANVAGLQQQIDMQAQHQQQARAQQAQVQQMMLNQNGMQGQIQRAMPQQPPQQGFQHLQHQMQASPIPGQPQMPMGMPNDGLPPNMVPNQQQQQQLQMMQQQARQQGQLQNGPGRGPSSIPPQDWETIQAWTNQMMSQALPEEKERIRMELQSKMDPAAIANYRQRNIDPVQLYYRNQAIQRYRQRAGQPGQNQAPAQHNISQQQQPQNLPATAPPMQPQRSMNPSPMNGQVQPPTANGGNPDFTFMGGNVGNIVDQQQQGQMAQDAGQMVVPANGAQRNATPQPGNMNMNGQRTNANSNMNAQQQQQFLNAQQSQQQRMQHVQAQQNARAQQAAAKMGLLHGQPGGMGPMPPHQSPAMSTLTAPLLRTPSQQMNQSEPPQANPNPNAQFGQPLDQRFMSRVPPNAMHSTMMATLGPEQQQRLTSLPPDKLQEVVNRWHEARAQSMHAANPQAAGRSQMPMQGNNPMRPGQGQMGGPPNNQQIALQQWFLANPNQQPPPQLLNGMSQQQQMALRQQMAMRQQQQQNPLQPRNPQQNGMPLLPPQMLHMDGMDFPPNLVNHPSMPRNIPQELKKWGQLKNWAQNNTSIPPDQVEAVKQLQKAHFAQIMRTRSQQGPHANGMPTNNGQGIPGQPPMVPPGMAAPVAPMGQNPMQMNGIGQQIHQPTPTDIQQARSHPQMNQLSDDQIRAILIRRQMNTMQQHQQRQAAMMQMANQNAQINGQPRAAMPPGNVAATQNMPPHVAQQRQPQAAPEPAAVVNKANKPATNGRPAQNPSPAPPAKNLKRASSDDVVEVPNPNTQSQRLTPQQNQTQKSTPHQSRPTTFTPEQIAQLTPEDRKKYEHGVRMVQQSQQGQNVGADNIAAMNRLKAIMTEEESKAASESLHDVPLDRAQTERVIKSLQANLGPIKGTKKAVGKWYLATRDDNRARKFFRFVSHITIIHWCFTNGN
jgi:hypothetical protein